MIPSLKSRNYLYVLYVVFAASVIFLQTPRIVSAQTPPPQDAQPATPQPAISAPKLDYPDSTKGLEHLAKDILKAQKENDPAAVATLLNSLALPNYEQWYSENFEEDAAATALPRYKAAGPTLSAQLAQFFLKAQQDRFTDIQAVRYVDSCDLNSAPQTINTLDARRTDVPLFELRFHNGTEFRALLAFAYVDGGFRFVLIPDFDLVFRGASSGSAAQSLTRIKMGGNQTRSMLVDKIQPQYPEEARQARISGTVRFHVLIGTDGKVKRVQLLSGACPLALSAYKAVRQWKYKPTTLNGSPVEVDTTIDVVFSLNQ